METFLHWLTEEVQLSKLKHLTHAEDEPTVNGKAGARSAIIALYQTHKHLTGQPTKAVSISRKEDGSPAVIFGHHPQNGKFFVATKSAFNKNPKINYTPNDVVKNHGHAPGLVKKLQASLEHLPKITPKRGIYQGDLMYEKPDVRETPSQFHFTPNTLTYNVAKASHEGKRVRQSKLGIVVHTKYKGTSLESMHPHAGTYEHEFSHHHDVNMISPKVTLEHPHIGTYDHPTQQKVKNHLKVAVQQFKKTPAATWEAAAQHKDHLSTFYNQNVRTGEKNSHENYQKYLSGKRKDEVLKYKSPEKKQGVIKKYDNLFRSSAAIKPLLVLHHHLSSAKNTLISALNKSAPSRYSYTIGNKPSQPEGYVVNRGKSRMTKLVNRGEFSKANFVKNA